MTIKEKLHSLDGEGLAKAVILITERCDDCSYGVDDDGNQCWSEECQACIDYVKAWLEDEYKDDDDLDITLHSMRRGCSHCNYCEKEEN